MNDPPKKNHVCFENKMFTVDWVETRDEIVAIGPDGETRRVGDYPRYFYVKVPEMICAKTFHGNLLLKMRQVSGTTGLSGGIGDVRLTEVRANSILGYVRETERFLKLSFEKDLVQTCAKKTLTQCFHLRDYCDSDGEVELFEANINKTTRYLTDNDLVPHHYFGDGSGPPPDLRILSWDIEVFSHDNAFPVAERPQDTIEQIGCTIGTQRTGEQERYVLTYQPIDPMESVEVVRFPDERALILGFFRFIRDKKPSVLTGYNVFGFDWDYILRRMKLLRINERAIQGTHAVDGCYARVVSKMLSTSAYGANEYKYVDIPGIVEIDMLAYVRKEKKLASYKLDSVSEELIGERKHDLPPLQIFAKLVGTDADRAVVAKYCVQDTDLVFKLLRKLRVVQNMMAMANVTYVPMNLLLTSGQQIKVKAQVLRAANEERKLIPTNPRVGHKGTYQGATVLDAQVGYYQDPVAGLDFASLYPSVMIAYNLSPDSACDASVPDAHAVVVDGETSYYVKSPMGVLPMIQQRLWTRRKAVKRAMAQETDPFLKDLLDSEQLAVKLSMNSIYGVLGSDTGFLPCKNVAASVTAMGRYLLELSKNYVEKHFPARVVYGDSVAPSTRVEITPVGGTPVECEIGEVHKRFGLVYSNRPDGKQEAFFPKGYTVRSLSDGNEVRSIIRHSNRKPMYRVSSEIDGRVVSVDVTEDHSLICEGDVAVRPADMRPGETMLLALKRFPLQSSEETSV